jgi:hypothetical protein
MLLKHSFFINKKQLAMFASASQRRSLISIFIFKPSKSRKNSFFAGVLTVMLLLVCEIGWGQNTTYDTPGTYIFTVPAGVTSITISAWGSGAGGDNPNHRGGGGGAFAGGTYTVTPGTQYAVTVGAGAGVGTGDNGQNSSFGTLVVAVGAVGRNGGVANNCTGQIRTAGGNGGTSTGRAGAGGGGSGGSGGNGGNGGGTNNNTPGAGGAAGIGNPSGASGGAGGGRNSDGVSGSFPGGGGGERGDDGNQSGGGGDGQVIVSWTIPTPTAPSTTGAVVCVGNTTTLSASDAINGDVYLWYSDATGGTLLKTSTSYTDNTFTTPILYATTNYWVSIRRSGQVSARTQVTASYPYPTSGSETTAGNDSWVGHIYDGTTFNNYLGSYTKTETFQEGFGTTGTWPGLAGDDASCFDINSGGSVLIQTLSVRYRMSSTRKGLYAIKITSDDGTRLYVDGAMVYADWGDYSPREHSNILFSLSGFSSLLLEYYENAGQNVVGFENLTQIISNTLTTNTDQSVCIGSSSAEISGDVFGTIPTGISLSGTGYQWAYSTSSTGPWNDIFGATSATYTPSTVMAPFNSVGTYYVIRKAVLSSVNNVSPNPYIASNESNVATITIVASPAPSFTAQPDPAECQGDDVIYTTEPLMTNYTWSVPGTDGSDYSITLGGIGTGSNTVTLKWLTTGGKTVTVGYTGGNGCPSASPASSVTTVNPTPVIGTFN